MSVINNTQGITDYCYKMRRELHKIPEFAFKEIQTSDFVVEELQSMGYKVRRSVGVTGLITVFDSGIPGNNILLRFDMDGLPVQEETGLDFASQNKGAMHACGHDGHMAIGLSIARYLAQNPDEITGKVYFVFQPAEEIGQGAKAIIADGLFDAISVDYALAVHLWAEQAYGWLGIPDGPLMAGSSDIQIEIFGKGGHAAKPDLTIDPLYIAAKVINALKNFYPGDDTAYQTGLVTLTQLEASDRRNIIADKVTMAGTARWFDDDMRKTLHNGITEIVNGISRQFGAHANITFKESTVPVVNDKKVTMVCRQIAKELRVDKVNVIVDDKYRTNLSEDFAYILNQVPGAMLLVGARKEFDGTAYPHHHPKFDIDERAMTLAVAILLKTVKNLTTQKNDGYD